MLIIYHNPNCSKSRKALEIISSKTKEFTIKEYLQQPLTKEELKEILIKLKLPIQEIIRTNEKEFTDYIGEKLSNERLLDLIIKHPILLERPIVINKDKAVIGRPPERILKLLE